MMASLLLDPRIDAERLRAGLRMSRELLRRLRRCATGLRSCRIAGTSEGPRLELVQVLTPCPPHRRLPPAAGARSEADLVIEQPHAVSRAAAVQSAIPTGSRGHSQATSTADPGRRPQPRTAPAFGVARTSAGRVRGQARDRTDAGATRGRLRETSRLSDRWPSCQALLDRALREFRRLRASSPVQCDK